MPTTHYRQKTVEFSLGGTGFQCQVQNWRLSNNTPNGERQYAQCPDGEFVEETTPDWNLELTFYSDWKLNGVSDYLTANDQATVAFVLRHHAEIAGSGVQWTGSCVIHAPTVGADVNTTEMTEVTLPCIGKPTYARL